MIQYPFTIFGDSIQVHAVVPSGQIGAWTDTAFLGVGPKGAPAFVRINNTLVKAGPPPTVVKGAGGVYNLAASLGDAQALLQVNKLVGDLAGGKTSYSGIYMGKSKNPVQETATTELDAQANATLFESFESLDGAALPKNARIFGLAAQVSQGSTNLLLGTQLEAGLGVQVWVFLGKAQGGWKKVEPGVKNFELKGVESLAFGIVSSEDIPMPGYFRLRYTFHGA